MREERNVPICRSLASADRKLKRRLVMPVSSPKCKKALRTIRPIAIRLMSACDGTENAEAGARAF